MRPHFDLIVIAAPPALTGDDAAAIGRAADLTLYVVRWRHTPRDAVRQGLRRLADLGTPPAGFVLTGTDLAAEARHGFARYGTGYAHLTAH